MLAEGHLSCYRTCKSSACISRAMDYSFPVQKRALSAGELTDIGSTLVGTYTSKLNSVTGSDVIRQTSYMLVAASIGLGVYLTILRPNLAVSATQLRGDVRNRLVIRYRASWLRKPSGLFAIILAESKVARMPRRTTQPTMTRTKCAGETSTLGGSTMPQKNS